MPLLGIDADLSAPPSSPTSFREVSLFAKAFRGYDVIAISPAGWESMYARWFRTYGLFDYIDEIVLPSQTGHMHVHITGGKNARLTAHNIGAVLRLL